MKKFIFLLLFIVVSCAENPNKSKIILTCGFDANPDELRFGIELNYNADLFFCEETQAGSGLYDYYYCKLANKEFEKLLFLVKRDFSNKPISNEIEVDARIYHFIVNSDKIKIDSVFVLSSLDSSQFVVIKKIIDLKDTNRMKKIDFHEFSSELLTYKLSIPPKGTPYQ